MKPPPGGLARVGPEPNRRVGKPEIEKQRTSGCLQATAGNLGDARRVPGPRAWDIGLSKLASGVAAAVGVGTGRAAFGPGPKAQAAIIPAPPIGAGSELEA